MTVNRLVSLLPPLVRRRLLSIWGLPVAVVLVVGATLSWFGYDEHRQAIEREFRFLESNTRIAEAQVAGLLRNVEQLLMRVGSEYRQLPAGRRSGFDAALAERMREFPELRSLVVLDGNGRVAFTASPKLKGFDSSQRDYFLAHLAKPLERNFYVSRPFKTATGNDVSIAFSLALRDAGGRLQGMVVTGMDPRYFEAVLSQVIPAAEGAISALFNGQRDMLCRLPEPERWRLTRLDNSPAVNEHLVSGIHRTRHSSISSTDGIERLYAIGRVGESDLHVAVGRGRASALADWRRNIALRVGIFVFATVLMFGLTGLAYRRQRERDREADFSAGLIESLPGVFYALDEAGRFVRWNTRMAEATGRELAGVHALEVIGPDDRDMVATCIGEVLREGAAKVEAMLLHRDGRQTPYFFTGHRTMIDGKIYLVGVATDISARREADQALRLAASIFRASNEAIVVTDANNRIVAANASFTRLTGYGEEEVRGKNPNVLSAGRTLPGVYAQMWESIAKDGSWQGELWDRRKDGEVYPKWLSISVLRDETGKVQNYIGIFVNIAERKASEERVRFLAHHDALTELPNRFHLIERLGHSLGFCKRNGKLLALMLIDLDRFKTINDTLGHLVGDRLLVQVADRLRQSVRESDILARLGGDEFVVALPGVEAPEDAGAVATKIVQALSVPYEIDGQELRSSPSIGISMYPADGGDASELLKKADMAMYEVKSHGRADFRFFTAEMQDAAARRLTLEADLRTALELGQFELHYQPQLDLRSGGISGVEALVRWRHPQRGLVPPGEFIPVAEETGLILALGEWVLREACRQMCLWRKAGMAGLRMSVNLSLRQFRDPGLAQLVSELIEACACDPGWLDLELTESMAMDEPLETIALMHHMATLGLNFSIDDFGTGYSSLAYLKLLPIRTLKIDRSFVKDIETDSNDADICDVTVLLAHKLGLQVVAEGVETEAQLKYLLSIGCERIQGYLISRPLPAAEAEAFIRAHVLRSGQGSVELWQTSSADAVGA